MTAEKILNKLNLGILVLALDARAMIPNTCKGFQFSLVHTPLGQFYKNNQT